jgi:hypothetical protein
VDAKFDDQGTKHLFSLKKKKKKKKKRERERESLSIEIILRFAA